MGKHFNPLEKEFLIRSYRSNGRIKLVDFCLANNVSDSSFKKWLKQYDEGGLEALVRATMSSDLAGQSVTTHRLITESAFYRRTGA
jgi:hypothetical protein